MSFGDLKVQDLIYEDSSNNEITVVIADLATKSNPVFSGTVTVPTATAGDNSTKAASTAFVVASFAPKNNATLTGTVSVPTASANDNTTKAASTAYVQTELGDYALKAGPTFTGTINAANLVLSADLTVNGTTTTINTTTLQVEDKNIEIGKVSTPSDATADGGGLTLLGATNKTWNWVNSTDAWTSSEHIQVASGKTFIGDGSTITALNASNISSGTVADARIAALTASKLTGALPAISGANLTNLPPGGNTVDLVADGAIAAGKPCIIKSNGKAAQVVESSSARTTTAGAYAHQSYISANGVRHGTIRTAVDDVNEITMITYVEQSSGEHKARLYRTLPTNSNILELVMAEDTIETDNAGTEDEWEDLIFLSSSRFMYIFYNSGAGCTRTKIGTISGSGNSWSISWSGAQNIDGNNPSNYGGMKLAKIGANRVAILAAAKNANARWTDGRPGVIIVDITSNTTITYRNFDQLNGNAVAAGEEQLNSLTYNSTDDLLLASWKRSASIGYVMAIKVASGTSATITKSASITTIESSDYDRNVTAWQSTQNKFIHAYRSGSSNNLIRTKVVTVNSSSLAISVGSAVDYTATPSYGLSIGISSLGSIYLNYVNGSRNPYQMVDSSFDGSAVSWVHAQVSTGIDGYAQVCRQVSLPSTRILVVYGLNGLSNRGYYFNIKTTQETTNLTASNCIFFAKDAISDGNTGSLITNGNVVGNQSGLTPGTRYFVQDDGTISTSYDSTTQTSLMAIASDKGLVQTKTAWT